MLFAIRKKLKTEDQYNIFLLAPPWWRAANRQRQVTCRKADIRKKYDNGNISSP